MTKVDGQKWVTTFLVGSIFDVKYDLPDSRIHIFTEQTNYPGIPLGSSAKKIIEFYLYSFQKTVDRDVSAEKVGVLLTDVGNVSVYRFTTRYPEDVPKLFAFYQESSHGSTVTIGFYSNDPMSLDIARDYLNKMYHAKLIPVAWSAR